MSLYLFIADTDLFLQGNQESYHIICSYTVKC